MTLPEFIALWQAQPFRAFRLHSARGSFVVTYPLGAAITPQMGVAVVVDDSRVATLSLEEIDRCEVFGEPADLGALMSSVPPEKLAAHAQLLATAMMASPVASEEQPNEVQPTEAADAGVIQWTQQRNETGAWITHADLHSGDGSLHFSTAGTRWSVHGAEQMENCSVLYLHHQDHPTVEQRMMFWPPDRATFESFSEAVSPSDAQKQLRKRDRDLARKPAAFPEPPAAYFRKIAVKRELEKPDGRKEMFGEDPVDSTRYEFLAVNHGRAQNPFVRDAVRNDLVLELVNTPWDAHFAQDGDQWRVWLQTSQDPQKEIELRIDMDRRGAAVSETGLLLPLPWIERHLRNFQLYERWDAMVESLLAGPVGAKSPDLTVPLGGMHSAELWAGEPRYATPFLQPRIVDQAGKTIFDLRDTPWSAAIPQEPRGVWIELRLFSGEDALRGNDESVELALDLEGRRAMQPGVEGWTSLGMIQAAVRTARTTKWLNEELGELMRKGRLLPTP